MDVVLWVLIGLLFFGSFVGLLFPLLPSILLIWAGFLLYTLGIGGSLSWIFWVGVLLLTGVIFLADVIANRYFVKRYGGSKAGEWAGMLGILVGAFVIPPFGIILVPFLAVFLTEWLVQRDAALALKIGTASLFAFLNSTLAKAIIQVVMIAWFFVEVL